MINQWFYCRKTIFISILYVVIKTISRLLFLRSKPAPIFKTSIKLSGRPERSDYQFFILDSMGSMIT